MSATLLPELEAELREAARRTAPREARRAGRGPGRGRAGGRRRTLVLAVLLALLLASVAVAAAVHFTRAGDPAPKRTGLGAPLSGPGHPDAAGARLLDVRAADPGGGLPWGIRLYRTTRRAACWQVGRVLGGRLGVIGADRLFHALPVEIDQCRPLDGAGHVFAVQDARVGDTRLVVYGFLGPRARSVRLSGAGPARTAAVGEEGAFLFVIALDDPARSPRHALTATYADGTTRPVEDVWPTEPRAGAGARAAAPPGYVDPLRGLPAPARLRRPLQVTRGRWDGDVVYRIAFRAPVATRRYGVRYQVRIDGPAEGRRCERRPMRTAGGPIPETVRAGQRIAVTITPGWQLRWGRGWCPGRYRVTVVLHDRAHPVGSFGFTAPAASGRPRRSAVTVARR
jgi:hypothetical protein